MGSADNYTEAILDDLNHGITYLAFEAMKIELGSGNDKFYIDSTHQGTTIIHTGDEVPQIDITNDIIYINTIAGVTSVRGGQGNENIRVNYDRDGFQTYLNGIAAVLNLNGLDGSDLYEIGLAGQGAALINVYDYLMGEASTDDLGVDRLRIYGTNLADIFLMRPGAVSSLELDDQREPVENGSIERVNYDGHINGELSIYGREGDDTFVLDDTSCTITVYGDAGDDTFQVGQVFQSPRDAQAGLAWEDFFDTTLTTRGYLSNGIKHPTTLYGGIGNDSFTVYHNLADLWLHGDEDDDTFRVRAFVKVDPNDPKAPMTNINGGQGADFISYTVNAPVHIEGGDGFDTVTVVGTEFGDDFVVTEVGVYGAGLFVQYHGVERVIVDALEGNDTFFIDSTAENVALEIVGGRGSDTFNVGGGDPDKPITVVSNDLQGHSGLVMQHVSSDDPRYQDVYAEWISANVADNDEAGIVITFCGGQPRVFENAYEVTDPLESALIWSQYAIVLTRSPEENVRVTAAPTLSKESEQRAGGLGIEVNGSLQGVTLLFDRNNWYIPQFINIAAPDDLLAEGRRFVNIQHSVIEGAVAEDGDEYDELAVLSVVVEVIDNDAADVVIAQTGEDTLVAEQGQFAQSDSYYAVLSRQPHGTVVIDIETDGQTLFDNDATTRQLVFSQSNWNTPQVVVVKADNDQLVEGIHYSRITHNINEFTDVDDYYGLALPDVAVGLAAEINGDINGRLIAEFGDPPANLVLVTHQIGAAFTAVVDEGQAVIDGTRAWTGVDAVLSGTAAEDEIWTITLNGTDYSYQVQDGDNLQMIAEQLAGAVDIDSRYSASFSGVVVAITVEDDTAFTARYEISDPLSAGIINFQAAVESADYWADIVIDLSGAVDEGTAWTFTLDGQPYTYTAGSNNETTILDFVDSTVTDDKAANVLVHQTGGGTYVTEPTDLVVLGDGQVTDGMLTDGGAIVIDSGSGPALNIRFYITEPDTQETVSKGLITISGDSVPEQSTWTNAVVVLSSRPDENGDRTINIGEVWKVEINGDLFTHTVVAGDTLVSIAQDLTNKINAASATYSAEAKAVTQFRGDFGVAILYETDFNNSVYTAQTLDYAGWSIAQNPEIYNAATIPHLTIKGTGDGETDFYGFTIDDDMLTEGGGQVKAIFDVDHGYERYDRILWGSQIRIYELVDVVIDDGNGGTRTIQVVSQVASGRGWSHPSTGAAGSNTWLDDYLEYTFTEAGTYYIELSNWIWWWNNWSRGLPQGMDYDLHVSVEHHSVNEFTFAPSPIAEIEKSDGSAQDVDDASMWFTFYDPEIGNGSDINSSTPYATIEGGGNGSWDIYQFEVTGDMLNQAGSALGVGTLQDLHTYYTTANIDLSGAVHTGDIWTAVINGISHSYTVNTPVTGFSGDLLTLDAIAAGLVEKINTTKPADATYAAEIGTSDHIVKIDDVNGFWVEVTQKVVVAGSVTRTQSSTTSVLYEDAVIEFGGIVNVGETWTLRIGTNNYNHVAATTSLDDIASGLSSEIPAGYSPVAAGAVLTLNNLGGRAISFSVTGTSPMGQATISGMPVQAGVTAIAWTEAIVTLNGTPHPGQMWRITLNDGSDLFYEYETGNSDGLAQIASGLRSAIITGTTYYANIVPGTGDRTLRIIHNTAGTPFNVAYSVSPADIEGNWQISGTPYSWSVANIVLGGTVTPHETWAVTLNGTDEYLYTPSTTSLDTIGINLRNAINPDYTASYNSATDTLTVEDSGGVTVTLDITPADIEGSTNIGSVKYGFVEIQLGGSIDTDDVWTVALNGISYGAPAPSDVLDDLGSALATDIEGTVYTSVYDATTNRLTIERKDGSGFTVQITHNSADATYSLTAQTSYLVDIQIAGTVHPAQQWSLTFTGGISDTISYTAGIAVSGFTGDLLTPEAVAAGLKNDFVTSTSDSIQILADGRTLRVEHIGGTFNVSSSILKAVPVSTMNINQASSTVSHYSLANVLLYGTVTPDERWTITLDDTPYHFTPSTASLDSVGAGLLAAIGSDYMVSYNNGTDTLTINEPVGVKVQMSITPAPVQASAVIGGTPQISWSHAILLTGISFAGDEWTITVGPDDFSYTTASDGLINAAAGLAQALHADPDYTTSSNGAVITLNRIDGHAVVIIVSKVEELRHRNELITNTTADGRKHYSTAVIELEGSVSSGDKWIITLHGEKYEHIAGSKQNLNGVAASLEALIPTSLYNVSRTGSDITVTVKGSAWFTGFTVETSQGGGSVKALFDIDHSSIIQGKDTRSYKTYHSFWFFWWSVTHYEDYHYVQSPYLEIVAPDGVTVLDSSADSAAVDPGSRSLLDPFLEYEFNLPGVYTIRVGSLRDYTVNNPYFPDRLEGVPAGLSYQLNISIQRHETNKSAITLVGKQIAVVEGPGLENQPAEIIAYDARTNTYTIDADWAHAVDATTRFEISYHMADEYPDYTPVFDTYQIVLTSPPTEDVIVDVVPYVTRTYHSDLAFLPEANYGENEALQVIVATPRAAIELGGTPDDTQTWTVTINGQDFDYHVQTDDTLEMVADGLAILIEAGYDEPEGSLQAIEVTVDGSTLIIEDDQDFTAEFSVSPEMAQPAVITGTQGNRDPTKWLEADVELTGPVSASEIWTIIIKGDRFSYTVQSGDGLADIAGKLADLIEQRDDYSAVIDGTVITLADKNGREFGVEVFISFATVIPQLVFTPTNWDIPQTVTVWAIDDDIVDGGDAKAFSPMDQRVNSIRGPVTIDGGIRYSDERFINDPFTLPTETNWPIPDGTMTGVGSIGDQLTLSDIYATHVDHLRGEMPGFDPRMNDFAYELTVLDGDAYGALLDVDFLQGRALAIKPEDSADDFTVGIPASSAGTMLIKGTGVSGTVYTSADVIFTGHLYNDQLWTLRIAGPGGTTDYTYTTNETDGITLKAIAQGLANEVSSIYNPVANGRFLSLSNTSGFEVELIDSSGRIVGLSGISTSWRQAEIWLAGDVIAGQTWKVTIGGDDYEYIVKADDTLQDIAAGLAIEIDGSSDYHSDIIYDTIIFAETSTWGDDAPAVNDGYFYGPVNPNIRVDEEVQVDTLNLYNGNSPSDDEGVLTDERIYGLGMGPDCTIGDRPLNGGITYYNLEAVNLELGYGNDNLLVTTTHGGSTTISSSDGNDIIDIKTIVGHTLVNTGDGNDEVNVGSDNDLIDEISALLTIDTGEGDDEVNIIDSADTNDNVGTLTQTTLTGLDMPLATELETLFIQAASGTYVLKASGYGIEIGLPDTPYITREDGYALVTLDYDMDAAELESVLEEVYGSMGVRVLAERLSGNVTYRITFGGDLAGENITELTWAEDRDTTGLEPSPDASVDVEITTLRDGSDMPLINVLQTITVNADSGTFRIHFMIEDEEGIMQDIITDDIAFDASADDMLEALSKVLNPNNINPALPFTYNVAVSKHDNVYHITFRGEHRSLAIDHIDSTDLVGTLELDTRIDGINYYAVETLNIDLGSGSDVFNVQGTSAKTNLNLYVGDERIYVSSEAGYDLDTTTDYLLGNLDDIDGMLNIDAGSGTHLLMISDESAITGDDNVLITDSHERATDRDDLLPVSEIYITGLAQGSITYRTDPANGDFAPGITIWTGWGNDIIEIDGTHYRDPLSPAYPLIRTITTLNTGLGDDEVTVDLHTGEDGFFVLNTQGPYDDELELAVDLEPGDHYIPADIVKVFVDDNELDPSEFVSNLENDSVGLIIDSDPPGRTVRVDVWKPVLERSYLPLSVSELQLQTDVLPGDLLTVRVNGVLNEEGIDFFIDDIEDTITFTAGSEPQDGSVVIVEFWRLTTGTFVIPQVPDPDMDYVDASASTLPLIIFGGQGGDHIIGGTVENIIFSDRGRVLYFENNGTGGEPVTVLGNGGPGDKTDGLIHEPGQIFIVDPFIGGDDTVIGGTMQTVALAGFGILQNFVGLTGNGNDIIIGGTGNDTIDAGEGNNIVLGDNGFVDLVIDNGVLSNIDLIETRDPNIGGSDDITTGSGNDIILGGTAGDLIHAGAGNDLIFGDHGRIETVIGSGIDANELPLSDCGLNDPFTFIAIDIYNAQDGGNDEIYGEDGEDIILGQQGDDTIYGGAHDDDIIGGHNVAGGHDGNDRLDGGSGNDVITGDNAIILRRGDALSPRVRVLSGGIIYDENDLVQVTSEFQINPTEVEVRDITILDHSLEIQDNPASLTFGNDYIAGGADDDVIFGQLGDDIIQGDGTIDELVEAYRDAGGALHVDPSFEDPDSDGDDYIEGNGGQDVIFGNLGQDDIIGGNSNLFALDTPQLRPDGSDLIFGGAGTDISRNNTGDGSQIGHALDSDMILGDNGNIFRLTGTAGVNTGSYLTFNYDIYSAALTIIPRVAELLDYTPGGLDYLPTTGQAANDIGAADEIHGESGDDFIYGMKGNDVLFGDAQDDDIIGGYDNDWISAGTGQDGVLGDDGRIYTSRNSEIGEPLYGIAGFDSRDLSLDIATPGKIQQATINVSGALKKTVNITPFKLGDPDDLDYAHELFTPLYANDIIYGGWGGDFLHGCDGDDAVSGAEALAMFYDMPFNNDNVLRFGEVRIGEFAAYDEYDPWHKVFVDENGVFTDEAAGIDFVLNFNHDEGSLDTRFDPEGTLSDGDDVIFGDLGNDWLVGGTGKDHLYGGYGTDLLNADDNHDTNAGVNDMSDTDATYEDIAFGGAGRDVLIANTGGDRLIDWAGEFNSYIVSYAPFGAFTISRCLQPGLMEYLYDLSASDGADPTRSADTGADMDRNGEPEGELGLVKQQDLDWRDQTGAPDDPQPGNIAGGRRDVLRSATFNTGSMAMSAFAPDSGVWEVNGGLLEVAAESLGGDAVSVFHVGDMLPVYYEILASISADKPIGGWKSNAYIIFDYYSPTDFKFAGINISINKMQMGHRDASGWVVDEQTPCRLKPNAAYNVLVAVNGTTVTILVDGTEVFSHVFEPRVIDGYSYGLNTGMVGMGSDNSQGSFDNVVVQILSPETTFEDNEDFSDGTADLFTGTKSGLWHVATRHYYAALNTGGDLALSLMDLGLPNGLQLNSVLQLQATVNTQVMAGIVFDYYDASDFKFAGIRVDTSEVVIGHYTAKRGWQYDASTQRMIQPGKDYELFVSLKGSTVSVSLNGQTVLGHVFNAVVVDGDFGLVANADSRFDDIRVNTDDPAFINEGDELLACCEAGEPVETTLTSSQLTPVVTEAIDRLTAIYQLDETEVALLNSVDFEIVDLGGLVLGYTSDLTVQIDINAAGHGWFVDATPSDDMEFSLQSDGTLMADSLSQADSSMDLLTVIMHELGHVLGFEDCGEEADSSELMSATLNPGVRRLCPTDMTGEIQTELGSKESVQQYEPGHIPTAEDNPTVSLQQPAQHRRSQTAKR
jgi:Ca2+-binding RTX toxin-like protein/phage tail sheath gpL-like